MNSTQSQKQNSPFISHLVIFLGIVLSLLTAVLRNDLIWPDDHFQALEPASHLVFQRSFLAWEWQKGYRSWSLPLLYVPVLWICKLLGITGGLIPIYAARCLNVVFAGWSFQRFLTLLELLELDTLPKVSALFAFSLLPAMLLWSPTCFADHWILMAWIILTPSLLQMERQKNSFNAFKIGLLTGLPIFFKYQAGILCLALALLFCFQKRRLKHIFFYCLGVLIYPLALATLDAFTYGQFASALLAQINSGESTSRFYGVSPFYDYLPRIVENLGLPFILSLTLCLFIPTLFMRQEVRSWVKKYHKLLSLFCLPLIFYFLVHSLIPHKETRFILPCLPLLFIIFGTGLQFSLQGLKKLYPEMKSLLTRTPILNHRLLHSTLLIVLAVLSFVVMQNTPLYLSSVNIAVLEDEIYRRRALTADPPAQCLLLLNHNWSWTRGKLILGDGLSVVESNLQDYSPSNLPDCKFVILPREELSTFLDRSAPHSWSMTKETPYSFLLLEQKEPVN